MPIYFQEIVTFAYKKQIQVDNNKRDSIAEGLKRLRQRIRSREDLDQQIAAALDPVQDPIIAQNLEKFNDHDLDFIYSMPLNVEYLSLLETFYSKFLKSENLDFRMDFDQAFKTLSPFMAFKTFTWILDWMTNDRRKKLRQHSDLKYFNDSEEILGAVEQFWNNLKRMRSKQLLAAFLNEDSDRTNKMLLCYMKYHVLDLSRLEKVVKVLQKLNPDDLDKDMIRNVAQPLNMKIEYQGKSEAKMEVGHLRKLYEGFITWLDLQIVGEGLVFVLQPGERYEPELQKMAIVNTWYSLSKSSNQLENDLKQAAPSLKSLLENWTRACLIDYVGYVDIDTGTVVKATFCYLAVKLALSRVALDFAFSLAASRGFVAHHYDENIGIILTLKGEVIIFEKSVVFLQKGYQNKWNRLNKIQDLKVGTFVKLRAHPTNVAEKVWTCNDFSTREPSRHTGTMIKGRLKF